MFDPQTFKVVVLRFDLRVLQRPLLFSTPAANVIRGAFGFTLSHVSSSLYEQVFSPYRICGGPSGLRTPPRPFVIRARQLDGRRIEPGDKYSFHIHVFSSEPAMLQTLSAAIESMATKGMGPNRATSNLLRVQAQELSLPLDSNNKAVQQIKIQFLSPTELKSEAGLVSYPDFSILFRRIRDRLSNLRAFYGAGPLTLDFAESSKRADLVQLVGSELTHVESTRRSSRTGQQHSLGGFTGWAEYRGPLAEFLPYLAAAQWTGVGRQTVWGKGEIQLN